MVLLLLLLSPQMPPDSIHQQTVPDIHREMDNTFCGVKIKIEMIKWRFYGPGKERHRRRPWGC